MKITHDDGNKITRTDTRQAAKFQKLICFEGWLANLEIKHSDAS
jgi:hypothetical protein